MLHILLFLMLNISPATLSERLFVGLPAGQAGTEFIIYLPFN
jgi:hypothetical protein